MLARNNLPFPYAGNVKKDMYMRYKTEKGTLWCSVSMIETVVMTIQLPILISIAVGL